MTIKVRKSSIRRGWAVLPYYQCTGPDGPAFDNTSKAELLRILRRRYGREVALEIA
jgi:hypothetical protein